MQPLRRLQIRGDRLALAALRAARATWLWPGEPCPSPLDPERVVALFRKRFTLDPEKVATLTNSCSGELVGCAACLQASRLPPTALDFDLTGLLEVFVPEPGPQRERFSAILAAFAAGQIAEGDLSASPMDRASIDRAPRPDAHALRE